MSPHTFLVLPSLMCSHTVTPSPHTPHTLTGSASQPPYGLCWCPAISASYLIATCTVSHAVFPHVPLSAVYLSFAGPAGRETTPSPSKNERPHSLVGLCTTAHDRLVVRLTMAVVILLQSIVFISLSALCCNQWPGNHPPTHHVRDDPGLCHDRPLLPV